ncbi:MAG: hypothetical protein QG671_190, partial [Actinomycetota bacterium]|nr:hypothetical protein [Actinomycetota bacterium]
RRMTVPGIQDWFAPFASERIVHPYCATERSGPRANDMLHLLHADEQDRLHDPAIVDDPAPLTGLDTMNDAVRQAKKDQDAWRNDVWVPGPARPEQSFADLQTLFGGRAVSGWLTWAPEEGSDRIRTQLVIHFQPHRHFPAAPDQP